MRDRQNVSDNNDLDPEQIEEGLAVTHIAQRRELTPTQAEALIKEHDAIRENLKEAVERAHEEKE